MSMRVGTLAIVLAGVLIVVIIGLFALNAYATYQEHMARVAELNAQATAEMQVVQARRATVVAAATAAAQATATAQAIGAQATVEAQASVVAYATAVAVDSTCLVSVSGHDATLIINGVGAETACNELTTKYNYVTAQGAYESASDTWQVNTGNGYVTLSYACSYQQGALTYSVYDDGLQTYGSTMCNHLSADPYMTPVPDDQATAIAQANADAQATADAAQANATATAQAEPIYVDLCTDTAYFGRCPHPHATWIVKMDQLDNGEATIDIGGGAAMVGDGSVHIAVAKETPNGTFQNVGTRDDSLSFDSLEEAVGDIMSTVYPDNGPAPGTYRLTITVGGHILPAHLLQLR